MAAFRLVPEFLKIVSSTTRFYPEITAAGSMKTDSKKSADASQRVRGRPRPEDVAIIESKLLGVALAEFLEHGYGGASMTRIVKVAGISKTTLYSRFPSKEHLFRAIIFKQIEQIAPAATLRSDSGLLGLERGLKSYANQMLDVNLRGELLGVNRLIYSESHRFPEIGAAAAERTALGIKRIAEFVKECAKAEGFTCKDPKAVAEVFIFSLRGWFVDVMITNQEITAAQSKRWADRVVHVLLSDRSAW